VFKDRDHEEMPNQNCTLLRLSAAPPHTRTSARIGGTAGKNWEVTKRKKSVGAKHALDPRAQGDSQTGRRTLTQTTSKNLEGASNQRGHPFSEHKEGK